MTWIQSVFHGSGYSFHGQGLAAAGRDGATAGTALPATAGHSLPRATAPPHCRNALQQCRESAVRKPLAKAERSRDRRAKPLGWPWNALGRYRLVD
jgi:hypothetical protein